MSWGGFGNGVGSRKEKEESGRIWELGRILQKRKKELGRILELWRILQRKKDELRGFFGNW
eukprot:7096582-Pyramimonas_sp.AAC.1